MNQVGKLLDEKFRSYREAQNGHLDGRDNLLEGAKIKVRLIA